MRGGVTVKSNVLGADARRGVQISFPGPVVTVIDDVIIDVNVVIFIRVFFIDCLFGTKPRETGSARFPSGLR